MHGWLRDITVASYTYDHELAVALSDSSPINLIVQCNLQLNQSMQVFLKQTTANRSGPRIDRLVPVTSDQLNGHFVAIIVR